MKTNYQMITSLMTYFHDLRASNLIKLQVSPYNLVIKNLSLSNVDDTLITPESLTRPERAAMLALDLAYEVYKQAQSAAGQLHNQNDFQFRYLSAPEGHKVYEACVQKALNGLSEKVTLLDLKN